MNLEKITVDIRPRLPWEAVDMGFVLARRWYWRLIRLWLVGATPCIILASLLALALPGQSAKWALLLFWFVKPACEPLLLIWISRALFGEKLTTVSTRNHLLESSTLTLLRRILLARLSPSRSFSLPVSFLEGQSGTDRRQRLDLLHDGYEPFFLTMALFAMELIFTFSFLSLIYWLIPENLRWINFGDFVFTPDGPILLTAYVLSVAIIAPFYTCSGFMLYISRRVRLEAWDIELGFKRMRSRLATRRNGISCVAAMLLMTLAATGIFPPEARTATDPEAAGQIITSVMEDKRFGSEETRYHWVRKDPQEETEPSPFWDQLLGNLSEVLNDIHDWLSPLLANYGKLLLFCCAGILLAIILLKYRRIRELLGYDFRAAGADHSPPEILFGLDLRPESLPDDIAGHCLHYLEADRKREAMSLLYRATLSALIHHGGLRIRSSFTENQCLQLIERSRPEEESAFFNALTSVWGAIAYGHRNPQTQKCYSLLENWTALYGEKA